MSSNTRDSTNRMTANYFVNHSQDYRLNRSPLSPITITKYMSFLVRQQQSKIN